MKVRAYYGGADCTRWASIYLKTTDGGDGIGCPYAAPWTGNEYTPENNILMTSERYYAIGGGIDVDDYYQLINPIMPKENQYSISITEFENEHSFLDTFKLTTIDHYTRTKVAVDAHGNILTFRHPRAPISAVDDNGNNVKQLIKQMNHDKSFLGYPGDSMILEFPRIFSRHAKLVLRADALKQSIHVQMQNEMGEWYTIEEVHPRASNFNNEIVNLQNQIEFGQSLRIRLFWTDKHYLDFVGIDTSAPAPVRIKTLSITSAIDIDDNNITSLLLTDDGQYSELIPSESIFLNFPITPQIGFRDFVLYVNGYYIPYEG